MRIQRVLLCFAVFLSAVSAWAVDAEDGRGSWIRPYASNPAYWEYQGEPVLLLGGAKTDHIFLLDDLEEHLDELVSVGGNYVRCTMSQREGPALKPHKRLDDNAFDLNQWNPDYWARFARCLKLCEASGIIVQIEVWDRFDFSQEHWAESPWRPANNVNYTQADSGLANQYGQPAWRDQQPFFHTVPGMKRYKEVYDRIRAHQECFVEKMLSYSLNHGNVLYCMDNETSTPPQWGLYWMEFISRKAAEIHAEVYVTDMFDDGWKPESSAKIRLALESPGKYGFIDVSQVNSRTFNEDHWNNIIWLVNQCSAHPRPLNNTKIYSDGQTTWGSGTPVDGVERFWRNLVAGAASCRFHRPGAGIGLNDIAKACIRSARALEEDVRLWDVKARQDLLGDREPDEAYLAAKPGTAYALYFTDGGSVTLDLRKHDDAFQVVWIEVASGERRKETKLRGGGWVSMEAPGGGGWVAAILRKGGRATAAE